MGKEIIPIMWGDPLLVERLKIMWMQGVSAGQIARSLGHGITRNAVLGKAHRLGLPHRGELKPKRQPAPVVPLNRKYKTKKIWTHSKPSQNPDRVCLHGFCMRSGTGSPPYCDEHKRTEKPKLTIPWEIPLSRLMGRRA